MSFKIRTILLSITLILFLCAFSYFMWPDILKYQGDLQYYTLRHLYLVFWSMFAAIFIGVSVGIILSRSLFSGWAERVMQIFNVGNAVPSMAVLALALVVLGIGDGPSIFALIMASLLPIVRNTYEGLRRVPSSLKESAKGIGLTPWQSLWLVEFPNALPIIFGGIRTALAINVGTAPLSFIIGGDSLGGMIIPGINLNNSGQLILGATATALLALILDALVATVSYWMLKRRGLA